MEFTWDLENNYEVNYHEIPKTSTASVVYGVEASYNYSFQRGVLYDFNLSLPFSYYKQEELARHHTIDRDDPDGHPWNQAGPLVAFRKSFVLSGDLNAIYLPYTLLDLVYAENLG